MFFSPNEWRSQGNIFIDNHLKAFLTPEISFYCRKEGLQPSYFIQSQGSEDLLHLRLDAVAHDELPRLLPNLPILTVRWYCPE